MLLFVIVSYLAIIKIVETRSNKVVPNSLIVPTKEQNKLIRAVKAIKPQDD